MMLKPLLEKLSITGILILALILRLAWAFAVKTSPVSDSHLYDVFAQNIAFKHQYAFPDGGLTVYWPVGTSAIYGMLYSVFGLSYIPVVIFNIVIGVSIVWLSFAICKRYFDPKVALIAALLIAIWPIMIQFTTILASELIFIFFTLSALFIWGHRSLARTPRTILWVACVCAATYIRPIALPLALILPTIEWIKQRDLRQYLLTLGLATLTSICLFAPWANRNHQLFGEYVLVSANGGVNLWMGNNPNSTGGYMPLPEIKFGNEVERDQYLKKQAIEFIKSNPASYLKLCLKRIVITYKAETIGIVWNGSLDQLDKKLLLSLKLLSSLYWWCMLALAAWGYWLYLKQNRGHLFHVLVVTSAFFFIFPILTVGQDRYHLPLNPFLAMFAAYAIHWLLQKRQSASAAIPPK